MTNFLLMLLLLLISPLILLSVIYVIFGISDDVERIDEEQMKLIDIELKRIYNGFMKLGSVVEYEEIPGLLHNDEPVYRKIK